MEGEKTADKAVGRTRGGLNTKLHTIVDGLGNPVEFMLLNFWGSAILDSVYTRLGTEKWKHPITDTT